MRALAFTSILLVATLAPAPPAAAQWEDSERIRIVGDDQLRNASLPGFGTAANPYVIQGRAFTAKDGPAIEIASTRLHLVIQDVRVQGTGADGQDAIRILGAQNVTILRADIQFARTGILLQQTDRVNVSASTVRAGRAGIMLEGATNASLTGNHLAVNAEDVSFRSHDGRHSVRNVFRHNDLSIATDQIGFAFSSPQVYDNDIDETNVVNFVPVRWYTHVRGTPDDPRWALGAAHVKGMTNVGQVVCYNCTNVRFDQVNATSGAAAGLVLEASRDVTVTRLFAQGNDAAGIAVKNSSNISIIGASLHANGLPSHPQGAGVYATNAPNLSVTSSTAAGNRHGIVVARSNGAVLASNVIDGNTADGLVLDETTLTRSSANTVTRNQGDGIRVLGPAGTRNVLTGETVVANGGAGIMLLKALEARVTGSRVDENGKGGIVFGSESLLSRADNNTLARNGDAGIRFDERSTLDRAENNTLEGHARHVRFLERAEQHMLDANTMSALEGETGLWFDGPESYNNRISTSNTVGGTPLQWHVALVGQPDAPVTFRGLRVETPNMTNVAQVMVFKSSYVLLEDVVASRGARGIYALRSSSLTVRDATLHDDQIGLHLQGTQTATVQRVLATGGRTGVQLGDTLNVSLADVSAPGMDVAIRFEGASRGSVVERTHASGTRQASIVDASATRDPPQHLIADAGLDKLQGAGRNVSFEDATGVARYGSERILRQSWDFGDGATETSEGAQALRPSHAYGTPGAYVARYTLETADGVRLSDTTEVRIVPPPESPAAIEANLTPERGSVALVWTPPPSELPITGYRVYRGLDPTNLTLLLETVANATTTQERFDASLRVFYAISASTAIAGEGPLSAPFEVVYEPPPPPPQARPPERPAAPPSPTPEDEGAYAPVPAWVVLAALAAAAIAARRRFAR